MVDAGVYVDGPCGSTRRRPSPRRRSASASTDGAMAWIGLFRPTDAQFRPVAEEFGLHELAVEDAIVAHQRPKLERYGDTLFVVLRAATYLDDGRGGRVRRDPRLRRPELRAHRPPQPHAGPGRRPAPDGEQPRSSSPSARRRSCTRSSTASSTATPRSSPGLDKDIDEIEAQVFRGDPKVSRRIYELSGEVIEFQRSTRPLHGMLEAPRRRLRQVRHERGAAALPARRRRPRDDGDRAGRRLPPEPLGHPDGQRDPREPGPERGGQAADRGELSRRTRR